MLVYTSPLLAPQQMGHTLVRLRRVASGNTEFSVRVRANGVKRHLYYVLPNLAIFLKYVIQVALFSTSLRSNSIRLRNITNNH